jgi:hypothetical protein
MPAPRARTVAASATIRSYELGGGRQVLHQIDALARPDHARREIVGLGGEIALLRVGPLGLELLLLAVPTLVEVVLQRPARILRRPRRAADDVEHARLRRLSAPEATTRDFMVSSHSDSLVAVKRVPIDTPAARGSAQLRAPRPSAMPPAATTGIEPRDVDHGRHEAHGAARRARVTAGVAALGDDDVDAEAGWPARPPPASAPDR